MNGEDEIRDALAKLYASLLKHSRPDLLEEFGPEKQKEIRDLLNRVEKAQSIFNEN